MSTTAPPWVDMPHPAELDGDEPPQDLAAPLEPPAPAPATVTPPHSLDAERECLAAVFTSPGVIVELERIVAPADFFVWQHQLVYGCMLGMLHAGHPIDPVTLQLTLQAQGLYERIGGARAIGELIDRSGTIANVAHYARVVADHARVRRLIEAARAIEVAAHQDVGDVDAFLVRAEATLDQAIAAARPRARLDLRSLSERSAEDGDWFETTPPSPDALLTWGDGTRQPLLMAAGRVALLAAAGGVGKTYALCQLAIAIATGQPWLASYAVSRKGRVLLALAEEDEAEIRRRLWSAARMLGRSGDDETAYLLSEARRNIVALPLMGQHVALLDRDHEPTPWHRRLLDELADQPLRAIIADPLSRWGGPDIETDAHAATRVIQLLEGLTKLPSAPAVIVAHHANKGALREDGERTQAVVRGHSALVDGARWVGYLERLTGRQRSRSRLSVVKSNYGPTPPSLELTRDGSGALRPMQPHELEAEREELDEARKAARQGGRP